MTIEQHAAAIEAAIQAAAVDGFYVTDDGEDDLIQFLDLNHYAVDGRLIKYVSMALQPDA